MLFSVNLQIIFPKLLTGPTAAVVLSKLQKVSKLRFGLLRQIIILHVLVMGVVDFLVSTFDKLK